MGEVIGPLHWSPEDRTKTWQVIRELREIIKYRKELQALQLKNGKTEEAEITAEAISKETIYMNDQFRRWMLNSEEAA